MPKVDAQATALRFNGAEVGGIQRFKFKEGAKGGEAVFKALSGPPVALPTPPDLGTCTVAVKVDHSDPGQNALRASYIQSKLGTLGIDYADGTTETLSAFCLKTPNIGDKAGADSVVGSSFVIRINGHPQ